MNTILALQAKEASRGSLTLFQRILLCTDGTVTNLIQEYTGEDIQVQKLGQTIGTEVAPRMLACDGPVPLLRRTILLRGSSRTYLYADSVFVFERLSASIQDQLLTTDRPIGLLWQEERLETYREIVDQRVEARCDVARHFGLPETTPSAARTYVVYQAGRPLGAITERWPLCVFDQSLPAEQPLFARESG